MKQTMNSVVLCLLEKILLRCGLFESVCTDKTDFCRQLPVVTIVGLPFTNIFLQKP
jgi:hypothetical protein